MSTQRMYIKRFLRTNDFWAYVLWTNAAHSCHLDTCSMLLGLCSALLPFLPILHDHDLSDNVSAAELWTYAPRSWPMGPSSALMALDLCSTIKTYGQMIYALVFYTYAPPSFCFYDVPFLAPSDRRYNDNLYHWTVRRLFFFSQECFSQAY